MPYQPIPRPSSTPRTRLLLCRRLHGQQWWYRGTVRVRIAGYQFPDRVRGPLGPVCQHPGLEALKRAVARGRPVLCDAILAPFEDVGVFVLVLVVAG